MISGDSKRNVLALLRVSSSVQAEAEKDGIPRQERQIADHCKKHNLTVAKEYRLEGISGARVQFDSQFRSMMKRLTEPEIAGVVVARMDRFFRPEFLDTYKIFESFRHYKKLLFCDLSDHGLDVTNAQDQLMIQLWGIVAAQERRNIKERTVEAKEKSREKADTKSDSLPKGVAYNPETKMFSYTDYAYRVVKPVFAAVLAGEALNSIVRRTEIDSHPALRLTLRNEWWVGNKTHKFKREYRHENDNDGKRVPLAKPVVTATNLAKTPLVSSTDFLKVQTILDRRRSTWSQNKTLGNDWLGPSLLYCQCGERMYFHQGHNGKGYYVCKSKTTSNSHSKGRGVRRGCVNFPAGDMDTLIIWTATQYFTDLTYIQNAIERDPKTTDQADDEAEAARLETLIKKLERQRDKAVANSLDPDLGDSYKPHVKRLTEELRAAQWDLTNIKAKLSKTRQKQDIVDMATELRDKFFGFGDPKKWTTQERKKVLMDTVERITYCPNPDDPIASLEFTMKGDLILERLSTKGLIRSFFESAMEKALREKQATEAEIQKLRVQNEKALAEATPAELNSIYPILGGKKPKDYDKLIAKVRADLEKKSSKIESRRKAASMSATRWSTR